MLSDKWNELRASIDWNKIEQYEVTHEYFNFIEKVILPEVLKLEALNKEMLEALKDLNYTKKKYSNLITRAEEAMK